MPSPVQPAQLSDLGGALRRHWMVVVTAAAVGLLLGVLVGLLIPARYAATTSVAVNPLNTDPFDIATDSRRSVSMATELQLAESRTVAAMAAQEIRGERRLTPQKVQDATTVEVPQDSLVLRIQFSGSTPREAANGADAVAEAYLQARLDDATEQVERLEEKAQTQVDTLQDLVDKTPEGDNVPELVDRSWKIQVDTLGSKLAEFATLDLDPGRVVGQAATPTQRSSLGVLPLGVAGLFLGLIAGVPLALTRKTDDTHIGGVDGLGVTDDQLVLDGTQDTDRAETWDIAAFMLKIPQNMAEDSAFMIMVDSEPAAGRPAPGQELVEALSRRGRAARFVDAGAINEGKISRGWPTDKKRRSWAGEVVVIDTTNVASDARKVALATRSDSVLVARSTTDDSAALRRLIGLFRSKGVDVALMALFPPRPEYIVLGE